MIFKVKSTNPTPLQPDDPRPIKSKKHRNLLPEHFFSGRRAGSQGSDLKSKKIASRQAAVVTPETEINVFPTTADQKRQLAEKLKPGCLVFTKMTKGTHRVDSLIHWSQKIVTAVTRRSSLQNSSSRFVHVSIVVRSDETGIWVAEAMPVKGKSHLRVVNLLEHNSCKLGPGSIYEYHIVAPDPKVEHIASQAATIAEKLAPQLEYGNRHAAKSKSKFSFKLGLKAILIKSHPKMTQGGYKRIFKNIFDASIREKTNDQELLNATGGKGKTRKFFCSYFASHVLQQAAAFEAWKMVLASPALSDELDALIKVQDGRVINADGEVSAWAKKMAKEQATALDSAMQSFKVDPKKTSVQKLKGHIQENKLFHPLMTIVPHS